MMTSSYRSFATLHRLDNIPRCNWRQTDRTAVQWRSDTKTDKEDETNRTTDDHRDDLEQSWSLRKKRRSKWLRKGIRRFSYNLPWTDWNQLWRMLYWRENSIQLSMLSLELSFVTHRVLPQLPFWESEVSKLREHHEQPCSGVIDLRKKRIISHHDVIMPNASTFRSSIGIDEGSLFKPSGILGTESISSSTSYTPSLSSSLTFNK